MVIIYRSNTGFTKEYAGMLGKAEKLKVCSITEAEDKIGPQEPVFFMGPLMAGHISGIDQAVKRYAVKGVCGVGMSTKSIREALRDKGSRRTPEEDRYLDFLLHGGSYVAFESLEAIRTWMGGLAL